MVMYYTKCGENWKKKSPLTRIVGQLLQDVKIKIALSMGELRILIKILVGDLGPS